MLPDSVKKLLLTHYCTRILRFEPKDTMTIEEGRTGMRLSVRACENVASWSQA